VRRAAVQASGLWATAHRPSRRRYTSTHAPHTTTTAHSYTLTCRTASRRGWRTRRRIRSGACQCTTSSCPTRWAPRPRRTPRARPRQTLGRKGAGRVSCCHAACGRMGWRWWRERQGGAEGGQGWRTWLHDCGRHEGPGSRHASRRASPEGSGGKARRVLRVPVLRVREARRELWATEGCGGGLCGSAGPERSPREGLRQRACAGTHRSCISSRRE
jgi:hypothetical protein